ncbi:uncharacterized protein H6S33_004425 [Morchella sextelata]|uniref:uncharacterized protein n=1 Tax=Morchella sextelata TaxID=1174677 RepID=UPI001D03C265|nr:uncharacterized protein H6S33_004425 [Morchella sextelata]KAH0605968.1 hypothetical protein H6S33_004425 [Morchella sextelata]
MYEDGEGNGHMQGPLLLLTRVPVLLLLLYATTCMYCMLLNAALCCWMLHGCTAGEDGVTERKKANEANKSSPLLHPKH